MLCGTMPDEKGVLSQEERVAAKTWLGTKGAGNSPCNACGTSNWLIAERVTYFPAAPNTVLGAVIPAVVLICSNCSNMRFHSAVRMSLLKGDEDKTKASEKKEGGNG